jgi:ADP-ribose pyrophosphatase
MSSRDGSSDKAKRKSALQPWEVLHSHDLVVAAPWLTLSVQQVRLPNGKIVNDYYQIHLHEFAVIFAQTTDGRVVMERQYRHGAGRVTLVLPAGSIEAGETPVAAAQRELLEETGYTSDDWRPLGSFVVHGNYGCGKAHLFAANNAQLVAEPDSGDLEDIEIILMNVGDLVDSVRNGDVALLGSAAAIALATNPLLSQGHG